MMSQIQGLKICPKVIQRFSLLQKSRGDLFEQREIDLDFLSDESVDNVH